MFLTRATSTSGHLVKDSESGGEPAGMERAGPCPVEVDNDVVEQLQVTPGEDSSSSTEVSSSSTEVSSPLNVSSFIRQGKDFPIIKVTGELTIKSKN